MGKYPDISAELLLNCICPDIADEMTVICDGAFYRNYSDDIISVDTDNKVVHLSRQGFLKLLPAGYISSEDELKGGDFHKKYGILTRRKTLLRDAFVPFDTVEFRRRLQLGRRLLDIQERKNELVLKTFYGFDVSEQQDPYILAVRHFIPFLNKYRGQMPFIRNLLSAVVGCPVKMVQDVYGEKDANESFIPRVRFFLFIEGLDSEGYRAKSEAIAPLCAFIKENLIPFEVECEISIKSRTERCGSILDYNIDVR